MIPLQKRLRLLSDSSSLDGSPTPSRLIRPLRALRERADPCHKTDDLRLELVRVLCVALHFGDEELRVQFGELLREASEHSGIRAFEHSSIYSLRCSQAQMPKCCSRALNAAKRC